MYKRIKDNIVNPRSLLIRRNDKFWVSFLYFLFLVLLLSVPSIVMNASFTELDANAKEQIKINLEDQLDVPCSIDYGLQCETNEVHVLEFPNLGVILDPVGDYTPETIGVNVVLREETIEIYSAKQAMLTFGYGSLEESADFWPAAWKQMDIDVESDVFWEQFFTGLDQLITDYRGIWFPLSIVSSIFVFTIVLLVEILFNTLILSLFRIGGMKFGQMFKVVLNAMTLYVIINVILGLYRLQLNSLLDAFIQMVPIIYIILATRIPLKR